MYLYVISLLTVGLDSIKEGNLSKLAVPLPGNTFFLGTNCSLYRKPQMRIEANFLVSELFPMEVCAFPFRILTHYLAVNFIDLDSIKEGKEGFESD